MSETLTCKKCRQEKSVSTFHVDRSKASGRRSSCKTCDLEHYIKVGKKQKRDPIRKEKKRVNDSAYYYRNKSLVDRLAVEYYGKPAGRAVKLLSAARARAKQYGWIFDITRDYVNDKIVAGICDRTGLVFDLARRTNTLRNPFAPSLDRISSADGYTKENVQIVCDMYNSGKGENTDLDFIAMCCAVAERHAQDPAVIQRLKELRNAEF